MNLTRGRGRLSTVVLALTGVAAAVLASAPAATAAPTTALIEGTVTGSDGAPLRNVSVAVVAVVGDYDFLPIEAGPVTTAADGSYRLRGDFDPAYELRLQFSAAGATGGTSATGYADSCFGGKPWCFNGGVDIRVAAGSSVTADVALGRAAVLTGRAVDALGRGIGGFPVSLWTGDPDQAGDSFSRPLRVTTTDVNGNYSFTQLPTWSFGQCFGNGDGVFGVPVVERATPSRDGYLGRCTDGAPVRTTAARTTVSDVQLIGGGGAAGQVVDEAGRPIAGATLTDGTAFPVATATAAADGTFRLGRLAAGPQTDISVGAAGYRSVLLTVAVRSFATTRVGQIVLQRTT